MSAHKAPMPVGYYRVFGGLAAQRAGRTILGAETGTAVTVWDADTGTRVTDLLADDATTPVSASRVNADGVIEPVGVPTSVVRPLFQVGESGVFLPPGSDSPSALTLDTAQNAAADAAASAAAADAARDEALATASAKVDRSELLDGSGLVLPAKLPDLSGTYAKRDGTVFGDTGRRYRTLLGTIRNSGSGWEVLTDSAHRGTGFGAVTVNADHIDIAYDTTATKVASVTATCDETFSAMGFRVGASVGTSSIKVYFYRESPHYIADYVSYNGSTWSSFNGVFTPSYNGAGILTLTHENMGTTGQQAIIATPRGTAGALAGAYGATTSEVSFYTGAWGSLTATGAASASQHRVYVVRYGQRATVPAVNPATISSTWGNVWINGLIEVA